MIRHIHQVLMDRFTITITIDGCGTRCSTLAPASCAFEIHELELELVLQIRACVAELSWNKYGTVSQLCATFPLVAGEAMQ